MRQTESYRLRCNISPRKYFSLEISMLFIKLDCTFMKSNRAFLVNRIKYVSSETVKI